MLMPPTVCQQPQMQDRLAPRQSELDLALEEILSLASHDGERRQKTRHHFTRPVTLFPCDPTGNHRTHPILCMGKEISAIGFGFFHQRPLPHRYLVLSLAPTLKYPNLLLMRMKRCRFLGENWYESGAQFLRVIPERDTESADEGVLETVVRGMSID